MFFEGSVRVGHPPTCAGYRDNNIVPLSMNSGLSNAANNSISLTADLPVSEVSENVPLAPAHSRGQGRTPPVLALPSTLGFQTAAGRMLQLHKKN